MSLRYLRAPFAVPMCVCLAQPTAMAGAQTYDLLVSSRSTNSVKRYNGQTGAYIDDFIEPNAGGLNTPQEVLVGPDGHLLVDGRFTDHVLKFHRRTGEFLGRFSSGYTLDEPTKMSYGPDGDLYVSQWGQQQSTIARFNGTSGSYIDDATPPLQQGMSAAWDSSDALYVVSFGSRDVRRFNADGSLHDVFTSGKNLQGPVNLWFDESGDLLVVDWQAGSVERFSGQDGTFVSTFITGFTNVEGWAVGPDDALYVADWAQNRVNRYDASTGAFLGTFASGGGLQQPNSVLFVERLATFTLSAPIGSDTVAAGSPASFAITVTPDPDVGFDEEITLSCVSPPVGIACSFASASLSPTDVALSTTLTISTSAIVSQAGAGRLLLILSVILILGVSCRKRDRRTSFRVGLGLAALIVLFVGACGGTSIEPSPNARVESIAVEASAPALSRTIVIRLTVE